MADLKDRGDDTELKEVQVPTLPDEFRLLIIGDSHVWRCEATFRRIFPNIALRIVSIGRQTEEIIDLYQCSILQSIAYSPSHIVLHQGHNDMAYDRRRNILPQISRDVIKQTLDFADTLRVNHPNARVILSAAFPRKSTPTSSLEPQRVQPYNTRCKRHGQRVRTFAKRNGYGHLINSFMWGKISGAKENPKMFLDDGLHLSKDGMEAQVISWIKEILRQDQELNIINPIPTVDDVNGTN